MSRALSLLLCASLSACTGQATKKTHEKTLLEPTPVYKTEEGRQGVWLDMARWFIENDMPQETLDMIHRIQTSNQLSPEVQVMQARALAAQGVFAEAQVILEKVIEATPRLPEAHQALGVIYIDLGELELATTTFERALKLDPSDTATRNNLGFVLMAMGRCAEATEHLEQVVSEDSSSERYRNNLAFSLVCEGDVDRAANLFRSTGTLADSRYNLGFALERMEKVSSAILQYRKALEIDPEYEKAAEALARLETPEGANP